MGKVEDSNAIIKCGLPCCTVDIIKPKVCVAGSGECLCVRGAASFAFDDNFVKSPMCAICFIQCLGESGAGVLKATGSLQFSRCNNRSSGDRDGALDVDGQHALRARARDFGNQQPSYLN